jgi:pimeloyl-ACP methyl ester carboxylesterase
MALALQAAGFDVQNLSYPCRRLPLGELVDLVRATLAAREPALGAEPLAYGVGHSLGGLVLRAVLAEPPSPWRAGRLVSIAAPHRGARVVAPLLRNAAARRFFGPVLADLAWESPALRALPRPTGALEIGVNARLGLTATTDGTVERDSACGAPWLPPFQDCIEVDCGHTFIAARAETIRQTLAFLVRGSFEHGPR